MREMSFMNCDVVTKAFHRIKNYLNETPLIQNEVLNSKFSSKFYFKFEGVQKTGSFKFRGALNALLHLRERDKSQNEVVCHSSGNHAQAVALAAKILGMHATIYVPKNASKVKIMGARIYGANVILTEDRQTANAMACEKGKSCFLLPPFDHDDVIAGQGTAVFEAWSEIGDFDAVFTPCSGGGLVSGAYLASRLFSDIAKVYAVEPEIANDAARSYRTGSIYSFSDSPMTIADGARSLSISERTFQYIKKLDGFYESSEEDIVRCVQFASHFLKINIEPTSALAISGALQWIKEGNEDKKILVVLSGGNMDHDSHVKVWEKDYLESFFE